MVKNTKVLYLEGFLWDHPAAKRAFIAAAVACKNSGGKVALSLSDSFCVERHRKSFLDLIDTHINILFANESEIISLYKTSDFEEALNKVRGCCKIAVLTRGELATSRPIALADALLSAPDIVISTNLLAPSPSRTI